MAMVGAWIVHLKSVSAKLEKEQYCWCRTHIKRQLSTRDSKTVVLTGVFCWPKCSMRDFRQNRFQGCCATFIAMEDKQFEVQSRELTTWMMYHRKLNDYLCMQAARLSILVPTWLYRNHPEHRRYKIPITMQSVEVYLQQTTLKTNDKMPENILADGKVCLICAWTWTIIIC